MANFSTLGLALFDSSRMCFSIALSKLPAAAFKFWVSSSFSLADESFDSSLRSFEILDSALVRAFSISAPGFGGCGNGKFLLAYAIYPLEGANLMLKSKLTTFLIAKLAYFCYKSCRQFDIRLGTLKAFLKEFSSAKWPLFDWCFCVRMPSIFSVSIYGPREWLASPRMMTFILWFCFCRWTLSLCIR